MPDCWVKSMWRRISFAWTESSIGVRRLLHVARACHWYPLHLSPLTTRLLRRLISRKCPTRSNSFAPSTNGRWRRMTCTVPTTYLLLSLTREPKAMGSRSASFQRGSSVTLLVPTKRFQVRARLSLEIALDRCAHSPPVRVLCQRR